MICTNRKVLVLLVCPCFCLSSIRLQTKTILTLLFYSCVFVPCFPTSKCSWSHKDLQGHRFYVSSVGDHLVWCSFYISAIISYIHVHVGLSRSGLISFNHTQKTIGDYSFSAASSNKFFKVVHLLIGARLSYF